MKDINEIKINPKTQSPIINLKELWSFRELFYIFTWRDIKVRYKQTFLGITWVILQPLFTMIIFTIIFGRFANIPSGKLPYALFVLIGIIFWMYLSGAVSRSTNSIVENENLIKKIYFPRLILPLSAVVTSTIDLIITFILLLGIITYFGFNLTLQFFLASLFAVIVIFLASSGLGLMFSSINAKYRDVKYLLPFVFQILLFASPVIYPVELLKSPYRLVLALNPLTGVIELIRASLGGFTVSVEIIIVSTISTFTLLLIGLIYFDRTEKLLTDIT